MARKPQISVIGYNSELCTQAAYQAAFRVGKALAEGGATLVTGGLEGVMEAASKGAAEAGGLSVGIVPLDDAAQANDYCGVVIPTGLGHGRNFLVANAADAVIIVGGGAGTLTEAAASYIKGKPLVAVKGTGGVADDWAGRYFDERRTLMVLGAESPEEAVSTALAAALRAQTKRSTKRPR